MSITQKVKIRDSGAAIKQALSSPPRLQRTTFKTSREMDFFSEKELVAQTGHARGEWPLVVVKELCDNALDACEEADVAPVITVTADAGGITVADNGPGLPEETLAGAMDFDVRTSSREAYVSPCRGAQGNALKTLLSMPWVLDQEHGKLVVTARGKRHEIRCGADPISQRAAITDEVTEEAKSKNSQNGHHDKACLIGGGTSVRVEWKAGDGFALWPFGYNYISEEEPYPAFLAILGGFAMFNPHATIRLDWFGRKRSWEATDAGWQKWKPHQPTSPRWYDRSHLERLIGAYVTHDREHKGDRLVSDLLAEFDGLSGSAKRTQVLDRSGLKRAKLSELVAGDRLDVGRIAKLLDAMQEATKPVSPARLGIIGEEHLKARLLSMGVKEESFRYTRRQAKDGLPWVFECAFGWLGGSRGLDGYEDEDDDYGYSARKIFAGVNWSATIKNPFRSFGDTGEGLETVLAQMRVTRGEPVAQVLHLAHPRVEYTDRGKSALVIGG